jgi:hypothetical protein
LFFVVVCVQKYDELAYAKKQKRRRRIDSLFVDGKFTFHFGTCIYEEISACYLLCLDATIP